MAETRSLRCVVVTPEKNVLDAEAEFIAIPGFDGEIGVLPGRAPLVARLGPGELRLKTGAGSVRYFVDGGFGQVLENVATILTPRAIRVDELDDAALEKHLEEINAEVPTTPEDLADKGRRLARARAQLRLVRK